MIVLAVLLLISGAGVLAIAPWGGLAAGGAIVLFVAAGFSGNCRLFGDIRPLHTGTNVLAAILIIVSLWVGYSGVRASGV